MAARNKPKKFEDDIEDEDRSKNAENLLKALKENGPCVIHDFQLLKSYFPNIKNDDRLKKLIDSYERRGKELSLKQNFLDDLIEMKNINQWLSIISKCISFPAKKNDFSHVLLEIYNQFSQDVKNNYYNETGEEGDDNEFDEDSEEGEDNDCEDDENDSASEDDEANEDYEDMFDIDGENGEENAKENDFFEKTNRQKIDYEAIYSYFNKILKREFPSKLQDKEAAIALSLMKKVSRMVKLRNENEKAFLLSEAWLEPTTANSNDTVNGQSDNSDADGTVNNDATNEFNRDQPEYYEDLPRFRKIRDCLNPLKIPSQILNKNHDLLSSRFHGSKESNFTPNS